MSIYLPWNHESEFQSRSCVENDMEFDEEIESGESSTKYSMDPIAQWIPKISAKLQAQDTQLQTQTLLFGFDTASCIFLRAAYINSKSKIIGSIILPEQSMSGCSIGSFFSHSELFGCEIISIHGEENLNTLVIIATRKVPIEIANAWTEVLFRYINTHRIFLLCSLLSTRVLENEQEDDACLRILKTSKATHLNSIAGVKALGTPRMVGGICAAVLTYCEIHKIEAYAYFGIHQSFVHTSALERSMVFHPLRNIFDTEMCYLLSAKDIQLRIQNLLLEKIHKETGAYAEISGLEQKQSSFESNSLYI